MNQAFLTINLAEEPFTAAKLSAVLRVIGGLLVREHVAKRRVRRKFQAANFKVDFANGLKLPGAVHVGLDVDGL